MRRIDRGIGSNKRAEPTATAWCAVPAPALAKRSHCRGRSPSPALICCSTGTLLADPGPACRARSHQPQTRYHSELGVRICNTSTMVASSKTCNVCGKAGHLARTCPSKGKSCDICGKVGHLRAVCPNANPVRSLLISAEQNDRARPTAAGSLSLHLLSAVL